MLNFSDEALSAHEKIAAKALIKKYEETGSLIFESKAPFWMKMAAHTTYSKGRAALMGALERGENYEVRFALKYPLELPNQEAA